MAGNEARSKLRAVMLKTIAPRSVMEKVQFGEEIVEAEVRQLTVSERDRVWERATEHANKGVKEGGKAKNPGAGGLAVFMVVSCCYVPGTSEKVFDDGDVEFLFGLPTGSWLERVGKRAIEMNGGEAEKQGKD